MSNRRTSPYSKDLREKVIEYITKGNLQNKACEVFNLHRNTVSRWWLRYKRLGITDAKLRLGLKSKVDTKLLESFVANNPNCKLSEIGSKFNITGAMAGVILKKLNYSYKKKHFPTWSKTLKSEKNT